MSKELYLILKKKNQETVNGDILDKIIAEQDINLRDYDVAYANGLDLFILNYRDEIADYIFEHGVSHLLNIGPLTENIIIAGTAQNKIIQVLINFLNKIKIDSELIIMDPYFFSPDKIGNYPDLVEAILVSFLPTIDILRIITHPKKVDRSLKSIIESKLKSHKPSIKIIHTTTISFHDRYWISCDRKKGLVIGTSLNGLGKKYALVDRLTGGDVKEIVKGLIALNLI